MDSDFDVAEDAQYKLLLVRWRCHLNVDGIPDAVLNEKRAHFKPVLSNIIVYTYYVYSCFTVAR